MLGVLVSNLTCKDKRNSGNHDIFWDILVCFLHNQILPLRQSDLLVHQGELLYAGSCNVGNPGNFSNNVMSFNHRMVFALTKK